jgi:hypothetical protein
MGYSRIMTPQAFSQSGINQPEVLAALQQLYKDCTIYQRLDALIQVVEACENPENDPHPLIQELRQDALKMIGLICDTANPEEASQKRKAFRAIKPNYLPNHAESLNPTTPFQSRHHFLRKQAQHYAAEWKKYLFLSPATIQLDAILKVARLNRLQREPLRVLIANGKLWQLIQPQTENEELLIKNYDTTEMVAHSKEYGKVSFVLSPQYELFAGSSYNGRFHHSSFLHGGPTRAAGLMTVKKGVLVYLDDCSGHYQPSLFHFLNLLRFFKRKSLIQAETQILNKLNQSPSNSLIGRGSYPALNTKNFLSALTASQYSTHKNANTKKGIFTKGLRDCCSFFSSIFNSKPAPQAQPTKPTLAPPKNEKTRGTCGLIY